MIDIENTDTFVRTIYAGNAVTRVQSSDSVKIITVRGSAFAASPDAGGNMSTESGMVFQYYQSDVMYVCVCVACMLSTHLSWYL